MAGRRRTTWVAGAPSLRSPAARRAEGGGVSRKKEPEQSESLTSPGPEAESSKFAPRDGSGASSLGPEATALRRPALPRRSTPGVSGPRSRSSRTSASVAPARPRGRGDGWSLSPLFLARAGARVNLNIQGPRALKAAAAPGNGGLAGSSARGEEEEDPASRPSGAPAVAAVGSRRRAPPRSHSARPPPPAPPHPLRELRPRRALFRLGQPLGGRDESPSPPAPGGPGGRAWLGWKDPLSSFRVQAPLRAPGAAERAR